MFQCEYANGRALGNPEDVGEDKGIARLHPGLALRALTFYGLRPDEDPIHALQLNFYETVLWRRWLCDDDCVHIDKLRGR